MLSNIVLWFQIISSFLIIILVVLQPSKGSDLGSMAGGSNSSSNKTYVEPITKFTGFLILGFLVTSFFVTYLDNKEQTSSLITSSYVDSNTQEVVLTEKLNSEGSNNDK